MHEKHKVVDKYTKRKEKTGNRKLITEKKSQIHQSHMLLNLGTRFSIFFFFINKIGNPSRE